MVEEREYENLDEIIVDSASIGCASIVSKFGFIGSGVGIFCAGVYKGFNSSQGVEVDSSFLHWFIANGAFGGASEFCRNAEHNTGGDNKLYFLKGSLIGLGIAPVVYGLGYGAGYLAGRMG